MQTATAQNTTTFKMPVQRGIRLHEQLLFDDGIAPVPKKDFNGRNPQLIENRDNFLMYRFYYLSKLQKVRIIYADILKQLAAETWLSELQVSKIIQDKSEQVFAIKKAAPTVQQLKQLFPHIIW